MFRTRRIDAKLAFPDRKVQSCPVPATTQERALQTLVAERITLFNALQQSSLLVALMSSPHALAAQLENMANNDSIHRSLAEQVRQVASRIVTPAKAAAVLRIADDLKKQGPHWRMVIFTTRKETQRMLGRVLEREGIPCEYISGGQPVRNRRAIEAFRKYPPDVNVIISTDAGAEGVNLQAANILVNYDLPWNPMIVEQRIGRVQRIGSKFKNVWVANVVHANSPEQRIVVRLMEKLQVISHTVGDIEAVLEANNDSNGDTMEKQIREMVVASLRGQNQDQAAMLAERSIEQARRLIEEHQEEMDHTLGAADEQESADVPMPQLTPVAPSVPLQQFVLEALESEGASVSEAGDGLFSVRTTSLGEERFTFEDRVLQQFTMAGVFRGRAPLLYQPGKPAFERLVQRWIDRGAARITDRRAPESDVAELAKRWVSTVPNACFVNAKLKKRQVQFSGNVLCRTRVANAIDSYEKLLRLTYSPDGSDFNGQFHAQQQVSASHLIPDLQSWVMQQVITDSDISEFRGYYEKRLETELKQSDSGERQKRLVSDLKPAITAEISAIEGAVTDCATLSVLWRLDGENTYESVLEIEGGTIASEPERRDCAVTKLTLPVDCLQKCQVTGEDAVREKLVRSEESGEYVVPDAVVTCEETGKRIHRDEIGICCITGRKACRRLLLTSEMSGRTALEAHAAKCEMTGTAVVEDELVRSDISGKYFRKDQAKPLRASVQQAHESEVTWCGYSQLWYPTQECSRSDVSGKPVANERLAISEASGRRGDLSESIRCQESGVLLLSDEVGRCSVTGHAVHKTLLRGCLETMKVASKSCFEECEVSGTWVLPEGLGQCCLTGRRVRKSLLGRSDASGKQCLLDKLVSCGVTGASLLPEETSVCQASGMQVDARCLGTCSVSGKSVLAEKLLQSSISGKRMLPQYTQRLPNGKVVGIKEVATCTWNRRYVRTEQAAVCKLSGLTFSKNLLNASGELAVLRECLDGKQKGTMFPEPGYLARVRPDIFRGLVTFNWISSNAGRTHIFFGKKSSFGFNSKIFGLVALGDLNGLQLCGTVVFGKRSKRVWQLTEAVSLGKR